MKRYLFTVFVLLYISAFFTVSASAHSGRTDSNGGHYNRSTGNYHYHHGYSAHDHYDMDGDGVVDCPYNFMDKTKHYTNDAENSAQTESNANIFVSPDSPIETKEQTFADRYGWILGLIGVFWMPIFSVICWCISNIIIMIKKHISNRKILHSLGIRSLKIPSNVVLLPDGSVSSGAPNLMQPYGQYTVYATKSGKTFHKNRRCSRGGAPLHVFEIPESLTPCKRCAKSVQYPVLIPSWYKEIKEKQNKT